MKIKNKKKILICFFVLFVGFLLICWGVYIPNSFENHRNISYEARNGMGSKEIAKDLEREGIIKNYWVFRTYVLTISFVVSEEPSSTMITS